MTIHRQLLKAESVAVIALTALMGTPILLWFLAPADFKMEAIAALTYAQDKLKARSGGSSSRSVRTYDREARTTLTLEDCARELDPKTGGWCELRVQGQNPGLRSIWPDIDRRTRQVVGPSAILGAWNSAAFDEASKTLYFMGGGGTDYGGNEVYAFTLQTGTWMRLTDPSPLDHITQLRKNHRIWIPDVERVPASTHTYGGLALNPVSRTLILLGSGAAVGAVTKGSEIASEMPRTINRGSRPMQYEFNPSTDETRGGLQPLSWRRIGEHAWVYPRVAVFPDGTLIAGSKQQLWRASIDHDGISTHGSSVSHADFGPGYLMYDARRETLWSSHKRSILALSTSGELKKRYPAPPGSGMSLALDTDGRLVSWDGRSLVATLDPEAAEPRWQVIDWGDQGPQQGQRGRVFGKWRHLGGNLFAGISSSLTGIWVYRAPNASKDAIEIRTERVQAWIDKANPGDTVTIPPGDYNSGLVINKSLTVNLSGVSFWGVEGSKGIIVVENPKGQVTINDFEADGRRAAADSGNLAGIRISGSDFDVTINRARIRNTVMGVLTDNRGGSLRIRNSVIGNTGHPNRRSSLTHIIYAGSIDHLELTDTRIERSRRLGHLVKSRAKTTTIRRSALLGLDGRHSRMIDISCGGSLLLEDSVLQSSTQADNTDLIAMGTEASRNCRGGKRPGTAVLLDNLFVVDRRGASNEPAGNAGMNVLFNWRTPPEQVRIENNRFVTVTGALSWQRANDPHTLPAIEGSNTFLRERAEADLQPALDSDPTL